MLMLMAGSSLLLFLLTLKAIERGDLAMKVIMEAWGYDQQPWI